MIKHQILVTNLQGNVSQLKGRIDNQILGVKGLRHQEIVHLCLLQLRVQLNVHIWIWQLSFSFCPSINLNYVCENWQIVTLRFVKLFKLGWMALFVVKRTTMKVKGVIVSASSPHLRHLNFKKKWYKLLHICNMYVEFHAELFLEKL